MELKQKLQCGKTVCGIMLSELYPPNIARILANCGYDFLLIDCEHGCFDMTQVANLTAVADGQGLDVLVRISGSLMGEVTKYMDMGVRGILLSNTENPGQARELINRCMYAPIGDRGVSTFRAHTNYQGGGIREIMKCANDRNVVIAQIESPGAVAQLDQICALPGLDGVLVGPNDLTQHMGIIGQYDRPEVREVLRRVRDTAHRFGKFSGIITANRDLIRFCANAGMTCFSVGSELNALASGARANYEDTMALLREERKEPQ